MYLPMPPIILLIDNNLSHIRCHYLTDYIIKYPYYAYDTRKDRSANEGLCSLVN